MIQKRFLREYTFDLSFHVLTRLLVNGAQLHVLLPHFFGYLHTVFKRTAARGIINNRDKYLLIFSRYGVYKFPGGGMEKGEELEDTLVREVEEETGYKVIKNSTEKYGKVFERRKGEYDDILEMKSYYFRCKVEEVVGSRNLDEYEEEYDYQIVWMTLPEAIEKNNAVTALDICPWVMRDTKVMELLVKEQYLN
ncbi:MAG: NUDIX domain-containing protein [Mobilitalea sp.]